MVPPVHDLDVVMLQKPYGGFPAGTTGTVVDVGPGVALVEVINPARLVGQLPARDAMDDVTEVPTRDLTVVAPARVGR